MFCTYLTIYKGNLLPPFYIGSSTIEKINKGYRGSVASEHYSATWKRELIDNPKNFKTIILTIHSTRKEALEKENSFHVMLDVVSNPLYINKTFAIPNSKFGARPKGYIVTDETRKNMSLAKTDEIRRNIGKFHKGFINVDGRMVPIDQYNEDEELKIKFKKQCKMPVIDSNGNRISISSDHYNKNRHLYTAVCGGVAVRIGDKITIVSKDKFKLNNYESVALDTVTVWSKIDKKFIKINTNDFCSDIHEYSQTGSKRCILKKNLKISKYNNRNKPFNSETMYDAPFWAYSKYINDIERLNSLFDLYDIYINNKDKNSRELTDIATEHKIKWNVKSGIIERFKKGYNPYDDHILHEYLEYHKA